MANDIVAPAKFEVCIIIIIYNLNKTAMECKLSSASKMKAGLHLITTIVVAESSNNVF